jgi:DNA-binding transcriptional MerR regulator
MEKAQDAFRTISEVADFLDTPAHVLRFWESRFPQIRPVKRGGGRRYYRPADIALLSGIKRLLHDDGLTIRGVQKLLREQGIRHVMALAGGRIAEGTLVAPPDEPADTGVNPVAGAGVLTFDDPSAARSTVSAAPARQNTAAEDGHRNAPSDWPVGTDGTAGNPQSDRQTDAAAFAGKATGTQTAEATGQFVRPAAAADPSQGVSADDSAMILEGPADGPGHLAPLIAARLRTVTPGDIAGHQAELIVLATRLRALRARLADAAGA